MFTGQFDYYQSLFYPRLPTLQIAMKVLCWGAKICYALNLHIFYSGQHGHNRNTRR